MKENNCLLTFVVIGKNEGGKLTKCFSSIIDACQLNGINNYEIIYVDSKSTDDSIERAKKFKIIRIYQITGECNAAIARNIGGKEAKGDILFFIDADMEIKIDFLNHAIIDNKLKYDCVTGHIDDYLYNKNGEYLGVKPRTYKGELQDGELKIKALGGVFIVKKYVWDQLKGMRTKYTRNEDFEFSFRLKKRNIPIIRLPFLIAKHHTIDYNNQDRMWEIFKDKYAFYPAMLIRDHITDHKVWMHTLRSKYTSLLLFSFIIVTIAIPSNYMLLLLIYTFVITIKIIKLVNNDINLNSINYFIKRILLQVMYDASYCAAFVFYFPRRKSVVYIGI